MKDKKLDDAIAQVAYIADCLMAYRNINETGRDCNQCAAAECTYKPRPGQIVRHNCPHYVEPKTGACDSITCTNEVKAHDTTTNGSEIPNTSPDHIAEDSKMVTAPQDHENEAISKQAALDALNCNVTIFGRQNAETVAKTIAEFMDRIKALPPMQAEPKRGGWIVKSLRNDLYECSECGQVIYSESHHDLREFHAYCSRCGAYMGGDATCQS